MTLHWIAYCVAVGALLALAATAAEAALRAARRPTRWAWAAALVLSVAVPAWSWWTPDAPPPAVDAVDSGGSLPFDLASVPVFETAAPAAWSPAALDRPLALAWGAASAAVLAALAALGGALHLRRRRWAESTVDGEPVLLSDGTGPAVVGWLRPRIVLPRWALAADPAERALLVEHEREHLRAGDPRLLLLALAALAALPFSPAAWWMLRRLRLAVEVDCDARVLARRADLAAYGALLLEVGRRGGRAPLPLVAFSEGASNLERRIRIMTARPVRAPRLRAAALAAAGAALLAAACETPGPAGPAPIPTEQTYAAEGAREGMQPARLTPREAIERHYPDVLTRGAGEGTEIFFIVSGEGEVVHHYRASRAPSAPGGRAEGSMGIRRVEELDVSPESIERMDVSRVPAGIMGPDPFSLVWIQQRPAGSTARALQPSRREGSLHIRTGAGASAAEARELVARHMPEVAARGTDAEFVWFVTDAAGAVVAQGDAGSRNGFEHEPDAIESVEVFRGGQVVLNGHEVPVIWIRLKA